MINNCDKVTIFLIDLYNNLTLQDFNIENWDIKNISIVDVAISDFVLDYIVNRAFGNNVAGFDSEMIEQEINKLKECN